MAVLYRVRFLTFYIAIYETVRDGMVNLKIINILGGHLKGQLFTENDAWLTRYNYFFSSGVYLRYY